MRYYMKNATEYDNNLLLLFFNAIQQSTYYILWIIYNLISVNVGTFLFFYFNKNKLKLK